MNDTGSGNSQPAPSAEVRDRLSSWKRIAVHFNRDVTTVQRWERREGMPVHRHVHDKQGSVYAFRSELDAWWEGRRGKLADSDEVLPRPALEEALTPAESARPPTPSESAAPADAEASVGDFRHQFRRRQRPHRRRLQPDRLRASEQLPLPRTRRPLIPRRLPRLLSPRLRSIRAAQAEPRTAQRARALRPRVRRPRAVPLRAAQRPRHRLPRARIASLKATP